MHEYHLYIYGGIILVTIVFLPDGIVGSLMRRASSDGFAAGRPWWRPLPQSGILPSRTRPALP
jgi:hypothetical protein